MIRRSRRTLCLDWDKRFLRFVVARVGAGGVSLEDAHSHRIPADVDPENSATMGEFIRQCMARHRIRLSRVVLDVPREKAAINRLRLPPTPANEIAAAVRFQALRELPFALDEAEIDYVTLATDDAGRVTEVLLAAVRNETLSRLRDTVVSAGLTPLRIGLRPYANRMAVTQLPGMHDKRVLMIDVGPTMTEIDVVRGPVLAFSRSAQVSVPAMGGEMDGEDSRVSSKAALAEQELSDSAVAATVDELLVEITRTLQAYRAAEPGVTIEQIVIAGGTGLEHELLAAVDERFGLPATLFDPTLALAVSDREAAKLRAFSAALGLAWGMSHEGRLELDFLHPKRPLPPQFELKRRLRMAGVAASVVLLAGVSWVVADRIQRGRELSSLRRANEALARQVLSKAEIDIRSLEALEWRGEAEMSLWLDHLLELTRAAVDPGKQMLVTGMTCDTAKATVSLKVACTGLDVATRFVDALNAVEQRGQRVYRADYGPWQVGRTVDERFEGSMELRVELVSLAAHRDLRKERQRSYERLRDAP